MEGSILLHQVQSKLAEKVPLSEDKIKARATSYVVFTCLVSAMSGALFGYDGGTTGGVSIMPGFASKFFPEQLAERSADRSYYCRSDDPVLQLFASVMYFTGAIASIPGALLSKRYGRTMTMTLAGMSFIVGSGILASAPRTSMLLLGRIFWGIGVGLADQAATIYSSEMAPPHLRGKLTMLFQLCVVTGIFVAQVINIGTSRLEPFGWRISLGLAVIPGAVLLIGGLLLPETPNSLIERGYLQRGRAVLEAIRGSADVDAEYGTIVYAHRREKAAGDNQWKTMASRKLRPHLVMSIALPFFQQWTGINAVVFFSPFIFQSLGSRFEGEFGSLVASAVVGAVQVFGTILGIYIVDRVGRRRILVQASIQTFLAELVLGIIFAVSVTEETRAISGTPAIASIVLICVFVIAFGYGWGPLAWVISSEIQPLETRSLGQGITVFTQLMSGAIVGQTFLAMLCTMGYGVYLFFGLLQLIATLFVYYFLPETTGIPIEKVSEVFRVHWYWKRFASSDDEGEAIQRELLQILERQKLQQRSGRLFGRSSRAQGDSGSLGSRESGSEELQARRSVYDSSLSLAERPDRDRSGAESSSSPEQPQEERVSKQERLSGASESER